MTTVTLTPSSTSPWLCPVGVYTLTGVKCKGPGGKGGPGNLTNRSGCGGGGAESAEEDNVAVTPGSSYAFTCPSGGSGLNTTFAGDSVTVIAHHGQDGTSASPGAGGTGSLNIRHFDGGQGGTSSSGNFAGAGGGSSAGDSAAGTAGGNSTSSAGGAGGTASSGGGNGGAGSATNSATGTAGSSPGGGGGGSGYLNGNKATGGDGQIILTYTVASNTTVTGVTGTIAVTGSGGTVGVGSAGTAGAVTVSGPAGVVTVLGNWTIFGATGNIAVAAPAGTVSIAVTGVPGTITVTGPGASVMVHLGAPAARTPAAVFTRRASRGQITQNKLPPRTASAQYSAVTPVQAPPASAWNIRRIVTTATVITWGARQLLSAPVTGPAEIEVLPVDGLPASGTVPQIAWRTRTAATARTLPLTTYVVRRQQSAAALPRRARRRPPASSLRQYSAARQAAGPPIAWRAYDGVTVTARVTWHLRRPVTRTGYAAWNTGPGTHGIVTVLLQAAWNTGGQLVSITAVVTWNMHALITSTGRISWAAVQHLTATRITAWNTLMTAATVRQAVRKRTAPSRVLHRGIRLGGHGLRSAAVTGSGVACVIRWRARSLVSAGTAASSGRQMSAVPGLLVPGLAIPGDPGSAQAGTGIAWNTRTLITANTRITWNAGHKTGAMPPQAAWNTTKIINVATGVTWNIRNPGICVVNAAWAVLDSGPVLTATVRWNVLIRASKSTVISWAVHQQQAAKIAVIRWDINPTVTVASPVIFWRVLGHASTAPAISWAVRQRTTVTATAGWDVIATMDPAVTLTWNLRSQIATAAASVQWDIGQPVQGSMRAAAMDEWFTPE